MARSTVLWICESRTSSDSLSNEISAGEVSGYIATLPGLSVEGGGDVSPENSFIKIIELIR